MIIYLALIVVSVVLAYYYLGNYIYAVFTDKKDLKIERIFYKVCRINQSSSHSWKKYTSIIIYIGFLSVLVLYILQRLQGILPYSQGKGAIDPLTAINTAVSFNTNTNWQSYIPEKTIGVLVTCLGLIVQQFISPAIGIMVALFLTSAIASNLNKKISRNFYRDFTRTIFRILAPFSFIFSILLVFCGIINTFSGQLHFNTITGDSIHIQSGPLAAMEAIKNIGTNGGGFYNANSAHPLENPNLLSNTLQIIGFLAIPVALIRMYGKFLERNEHAISLAITIAAMATVSTGLATYFESHGYYSLSTTMEGKEVRFGNFWSALYGSLTTLTANGGVNAAHDSFLPLSGLFFLFNMLLGEIAPGGAGSGLYGIVVLAILTSFIFGLMIGKLPSYCQKKIEKFDITMISLYMLSTPLFFILFICLTVLSVPLSRLTSNPGAHGLTELFYGYASMTGNNGSAFAGLASSQTAVNIYGAIAMFLSRYVAIVIIMALAGSLYRKQIKKSEEGVLPISGFTFSLNFAITIFVIVAISYLPFLIMGPILDLVGS